MEEVGTLSRADRILNGAEVHAVNCLNTREQTHREIITDLLMAIGRARVELEYAKVRLQGIVE
jgi:hypothetical protein